ncbi:MAG: ATP-dependent DNA ligase [Euryarchaeota archaeon]|nr:ATP-dependent DNA ligase [Euryarchaeota archaeon]
MTSFLHFAQLCQNIDRVGGSLEKTDLLASFLVELDDDELAVVASFVMGSVFPASSDMLLGVGPSTLYEALSKASGCSLPDITEMLKRSGDPGLVAAEVMKNKQPTFASFLGEDELSTLSISEVYSTFLNIARSSGKRSQGVRMKNLQYLFSQSTSLEAQYIARMALEDMRIGVGEGIVRNAVAKAFDQPADLVESGYNLTSDLGLVAQKARQDHLFELTIIINKPIKMMLAQLGESASSALQDMGKAAVEWKFDGARVQIHKKGDEVQVFSRRLENVTRSLPEIVKTVKDHVRAESAILDGEAVAIGEDGRPGPFQDVLKRFRRKYNVKRTAALFPLKLYLFDLVYLDGESLLDRPFLERRELLEKIADPEVTADQIVTDDPREAERVYASALETGHEGVLIKNPTSPYAPGKRGKNWLKIKPVMETLDLVVTGARWGEGRRAKLLGTYRLACIEPQTGGLVDVGWVATGITDEMLADLTELFSDKMVAEGGLEVELKPEVVFEVAYEEIQKSPNYSSGYALRFPRLVGVRDDKSVAEADSLERVASLYATQRGRNGPAAEHGGTR